ncbi:MAG: LacI family DNA-binding transcriptional regulator, partial [Oscillospiraceae bacterium]
MATIEDIARGAGVSHGTVSNVLNGRGNVSAEKIKAVREVAARLGYKINTTAQELRQKATKTVALLLPSAVYGWCAVLYEELQQELLSFGYTVRLFSTQNAEALEKQMLATALEGRVCAVLAASCLPNASQYYRQEAAGIPVLFLNRSAKLSSQTPRIGFQFDAAGRGIAQRVKAHGAKMVGVFLAAAEQHLA